MRLYILYDPTKIGTVSGKNGELVKLKINIPKSWLDLPCEKLLDLFLETVQHDKNFDIEAANLEIKCGGVIMQSTDIIGKRIHEYNELFVTKKIIKLPETDTGDTGNHRCTNYGCGKLFHPEENTDISCHFHVNGPVFHDLEKHWSCCPNHKAFDWDEFQRIPTCQVGKHNTENKAVIVAEQTIMNTPLSSSQIVASCSDMLTVKRSTGPREFEGAKLAQQKIVDGIAKCRNFGCNKEFDLKNNSDSACEYHREGPVMWDTRKYWKCCPQFKCYEFDEFMKIPGCCTGSHQV